MSTSHLQPIGPWGDAAQEILDIQAGRTPRVIRTPEDAASYARALTAVRRSPVSAPASAAAFEAEAAPVAETDAQACQQLRERLISLFNCPEIHFGEKEEALAYLETIRDNRARLTSWERNVRAEVGRRRDNATTRRAGLAGALKPTCGECGGPVGYNQVGCDTCYQATSQRAA